MRGPDQSPPATCRHGAMRHTSLFVIEIHPHRALYSVRDREKVTMTQADTAQMDPAQSRGTAWLTTAGLRPTRQRVALAALLVGDGKHRHVTAESLFAAVQDHGESVSLATVYNTLRAFCDAGLMHEITVDGSKSYFDTNTHDHPHFYWEDSGTLSDAPSEELEITRIPQAPDGAEIASVDVVIRLRRK